LLAAGTLRVLLAVLPHGCSPTALATDTLRVLLCRLRRLLMGPVLQRA